LNSSPTLSASLMVSMLVLNEVLSGDDQELVLNRVHDYLRELAGKMRDFSIQVQKYIIYTVCVDPLSDIFKILC